jgi:hypothetical protein
MFVGLKYLHSTSGLYILLAWTLYDFIRSAYYMLTLLKHHFYFLSWTRYSLSAWFLYPLIVYLEITSLLQVIDNLNEEENIMYSVLGLDFKALLIGYGVISYLFITPLLMFQMYKTYKVRDASFMFHLVF